MSSVVELTGSGGESTDRGRGRRDRQFEDWFRPTYPLLVGLARRVLDAQKSSPASLGTAEDLVVDAVARRRWRRVDDDATEALIGRVLDGCSDAMVGHPGSVPTPPHVSEHGLGSGDRLQLAELHEALASMRRADRHVGLLGVAGGYSASEVALLLGRPLQDVLARLARVGTRIADARRVGLAPLSDPGKG